MGRAANKEIFENSAIVIAAPGLTSAEARRRLAEFGRNTISEQVPPRWKIFLAKFWGPIPWMLEAAIVLQIALGVYVEAAVIGGLLLFNATLGFLQEGRAGEALAALKQTAGADRAGFARRRVAAHCGVGTRSGRCHQAGARRHGPGRCDPRIGLGHGRPVDANGRVFPVDAGPGSQVYAGALVRRGQAVAEVTATGAKTNFGRTAELVRVAHAASTEQTAIFAVTRNLAIVNGAVAALIIAYAYVAAMPVADQIRLGLTALLATIPLALPATFTLSAALSAQILAARGVLLTRLSAAHEAAAMDVLCADKTGTLTRNTLTVADVVAMAGFARERVLALAALASSEADQDPIDAAIRAAAAKTADAGASERLVQFVPFDPATKRSEAVAVDRDNRELHVTKGAFEIIAKLAAVPADASRQVDELAARGNRVHCRGRGRAWTRCASPASSRSVIRRARIPQSWSPTYAPWASAP